MNELITPQIVFQLDVRYKFIASVIVRAVRNGYNGVTITKENTFDLITIIGAVTLVLILTTNVKLQTIVINTLPTNIVKIILAINLVMTMFISFLLVVGAVKRNRFMMLPWVILAIMLAIGLGISVIYTAVVYYIHEEVLGGTLFLIFGLLSTAIYIYLWLVVFSYYQLLQEEKGKGPYDRSAYKR